jgi:hypothetical protein
MFWLFWRLDGNVPIYASSVTGMTGARHYTQLLSVEMGSHDFLFFFLTWAGLEWSSLA